MDDDVGENCAAFRHHAYNHTFSYLGAFTNGPTCLQMFDGPALLRSARGWNRVQNRHSHRRRIHQNHQVQDHVVFQQSNSIWAASTVKTGLEQLYGKIRKHGVYNYDQQGAAAYQLGNTSSRTITEVKQC